MNDQPEAVRDIITYSLRAGERTSDRYYQVISKLCDEVLDQAWRLTAEVLLPFQEWQKDPVRTNNEAILELLSLGVYWRVYIHTAVTSRKPVRRTMTWLVSLRKRSEFLKPGVDVLRGWMGLWLAPSQKSPTQPIPITQKNLVTLLDWLQASGDFSEEVKRLLGWRKFLATLSPHEFAVTIQKAIDLAGWFESHSREILGPYTRNVETFLSQVHPGYRWREDFIFTGRQPLEYHLSMLATEILNRGFRERFLEKDRKIVIVPPCMKAQSEEECLARTTPFGERCANCTPACRINQVTRLGEKVGFDVFIIPDELKVFSTDQKGSSILHSVGVLGISCPLTNASGGWEMKDLAVPAQGLLLDYCGCKWHWHKQGIPTDINFRQLLHLLDIQD